MRRLNHIGTHPVHTDLAILNAIEYQNTPASSAKRPDCSTCSITGRVSSEMCPEL